MIRLAQTTDADSVAEIYNYYIKNTVITFEEEPVSSSNMAERITEVNALDLPWFVAEYGGEVIGYAYATKWKGRCAYRFSVEITVYLSPSVSAKGWGTKLYHALFSQLKANSIHTAIGGIALPNPASVALHEKFGMQKVAHFNEVGFKFNRWIDVGYWQVQLSA